MMQVLHYNGNASADLRELTNNNRGIARRKGRITPGRSDINNSLDEYPMASTEEGGKPDVSVKWVPAPENASQGGTLWSTVYGRYNMQSHDPFIAITVPRTGIKKLK